MRKIRTIEDLEVQLKKEFGWRIKELSMLQNRVNTSEGEMLRTALRSAIVLLYAHWEGFVKNAAQHYVKFVRGQVSAQSLCYNDLSRSFIALSLSDHLNTWNHIEKKWTIPEKITVFLLDNPSEPAKVPDVDIIKTYSNLKSEVLQEILSIIGLDYTPYETYANLINRTFVDTRHAVAHGNYLPQTFDKILYLQVHQDIMRLMNILSDQIYQAAADEAYHQ